MDRATLALAGYVQDKGVSVVKIAESTGLPYGAIRPSLCVEPTRKLKAEEYLRICGFLNIDPKALWNMPPTDKKGA